ncbi:hypothetical protein Nepgr_023893 [Nepenthes gracilis]|uniref:Beta-fructofuranosidase n=1 Tax=Nepenthes gracilis TaxID=150966 RepID=A0AAD3XZI9_NEPGR|nr:hypothetical protein Nepgr_023893 [Nepenthes gracilis]
MAFCSHGVLLVFFLFSLLTGHGIEASHQIYRRLQTTAAAPSPPGHQPYRTGYHFQPPKNWINGAMIYIRVYHLFYQYNPNGMVLGRPVWAHSTSTDVVNWMPQEVAISSSIPSDINGCGSENQQVQNLAVPKNLSDPYLREWVKPAVNPLMAPTAMNKINASSFRDPTTAWLLPDKHWRVVIGNKRDQGHRGMALLYRSKDFIHWAKAKHPLHFAKGTGMWECPDFYPVYVDSIFGVDTSTMGPNIKHVLKASLDDTKHDFYTIGSYDIRKDIYTPDKGSVEGDSSLRYDYGKYYASKTFYDESTRRRILLGWVNESSSTADDMKKRWFGIHATPRTILLDEYGKQLVQWPIKEIEMLREKPIDLSGKLIKQGSSIEVPTITAAQANVEISFRLTKLTSVENIDPAWTNPQLLCSRKEAMVQGGVGPFGLLTLASKGLEEYTAIFFRIFKSPDNYMVLMCSDQIRFSLNPTNDKTTCGTFIDADPIHGELLLRTLIDHSVMESFGAMGKNCITARVYPTLAIDDNAHLYAFNYGTEKVEITRLTGWSMKKAHIN